MYGRKKSQFTFNATCKATIQHFDGPTYCLHKGVILKAVIKFFYILTN